MTTDEQPASRATLLTPKGPTRKSPSLRPTSWWLGILRKRAERMHDEYVDTSQPIEFSDEVERNAAIKFFNAALRAEESGLRQAHELADEVHAWDPELAEVLQLYGSEEGWHEGLVTDFLGYLGGAVTPMGRVTSTFYRLHARAKRMETIVLVNLMFEVIGATTYRMALRNVQHPAARHMLTILTRDESFHVPLNVHFLQRIIQRNPAAKKRMQLVFMPLYLSLVALPWASRPKAKAFDRIEASDLARAYAEQLAILFLSEPELGLTPPGWLLKRFGLKADELRKTEGPGVASAYAAEQAADRQQVQVAAL